MHPTIGSSESATKALRCAVQKDRHAAFVCVNGPVVNPLRRFDIGQAADPMMLAADRFLKFATECQAMAKSSREHENKRVWNGLAERWLRCAKLVEQLDTDVRSSELKRRQKHLKIVIRKSPA
jgi:hypothetical protein